MCFRKICSPFSSFSSPRWPEEGGLWLFCLPYEGNISVRCAQQVGGHCLNAEMIPSHPFLPRRVVSHTNTTSIFPKTTQVGCEWLLPAAAPEAISIQPVITAKSFTPPASPSFFNINPTELHRPPESWVCLRVSVLTLKSVKYVPGSRVIPAAPFLLGSG